MHTIAVIAFEGISPFHLSVPCIVFGDELLKLGVPRYRLLICGETTGPVPTMSGFRIEVEHDLGSLAEADTVIVPAWRDPNERPSEALLTALRMAHARGARLVGLCLGTFVLAEAGLLDGRGASTHWAWAGEFERRYPQVALNPNALYIDDGDVLTSAGTAASIDCCLHIVRRDHGAEIANRIARRLVVAPHRHGGQAQ
ncbi:MAG: AraC family transcriptional regulator, partial [Phyllobacterium sp.]